MTWGYWHNARVKILVLIPSGAYSMRLLIRKFSVSESLDRQKETKIMAARSSRR